MTTRSARAKTGSTVKTTAAKPVSKPEKKHKKKAAEEKVKVVRDSFTMPQDDYALIAELKEKAASGGIHAKKSELLRAGLRLLAKSTTAQMKKAMADLEKIKTGRPKKS